MRKIENKDLEKKKKQRMQILVGLVLIFLLLISTFGFSQLNARSSGTTKENSKTYEYNGYEFVNNQGLWIMNVNGAALYFQNFPTDLSEEQILVQNVPGFNNYLDKPLYISSEYLGLTQRIHGNLIYVTERVQEACLQGDDCADTEKPIKSCEDNFIVLKTAEEKNVVVDGNCIFLYGDFNELSRLTDAYMYKTLGVF